MDFKIIQILQAQLISILENNMSKKEYQKIWKTIKPALDEIDIITGPFYELSRGNEKEEFRISNLKKQFKRGVMMAESSKYLPLKNKPTWEGYDFNEFAILYCFEQILSEITVTRIQNGLSGASEEAIKEEAKSQTYLGVYPEITDMAIESYNKSVNEGSMGPIQSAILKLLGDKSLDFDAPAVKAVKGFFKKIF